MGWNETYARYSYDNTAKQEVWWVDGANTYKPASKPIKRFLVIHHTAGTDSRAYLRANPRGVSAHYLIGAYDGSQVHRVYKYALEKAECTHTQGYGTIGGFSGLNLNDVCISVEIEGPPISYELSRAAANLARAILDGWHDSGNPLLMLRHRDIDTNKQDPDLDWQVFCEMVYGTR